MYVQLREHRLYKDCLVLILSDVAIIPRNNGIHFLVQHKQHRNSLLKGDIARLSHWTGLFWLFGALGLSSDSDSLMKLFVNGHVSITKLKWYFLTH